MANFTSSEANACIIKLCAKNELESVHQFYTFGVVDDNAFYYEWTDSELVAGASTGQIKVAIKNHLISIMKREVPPVIVKTDDLSIIGDTVG